MDGPNLSKLSHGGARWHTAVVGSVVWPVARWARWHMDLGAGFALSSALGCGGSAAGPDPRWTSTHFRYFADSDDPSPCASVTDLLEQHFSVMQSYLGFDWPATKTVDYDKFRDANAFRTNSTCQAPQVACESAGTVQSTSTFDQHELIHAYLSPSGRPPALFEEGIAVVLTWESMVCTALDRPDRSRPFMGRRHSHRRSEHRRADIPIWCPARRPSAATIRSRSVHASLPRATQDRDARHG